MQRLTPLKIFLPLLSILLFSVFANRASAEKKKKVKPPPEISIYDIDTLKVPIPFRRALFHQYVADELRHADATDGYRDKFIWAGDDTLASTVLTQAILHDAAHLDTMIENLPISDKQAEMQTKIGYLKNLQNLLKRFNRAPFNSDPYYYKKLVANWRGLLIARQENRVMDFVRANANIYSMNNAEMLEGFPEARTYVYAAVGRDNPKMMIRRLPEFANEPFADSIIIAAARVVPTEIYTYASSTNYTISGAIRRTNDPLVQSIVKITKESKNPLKAMSFLNDIYTGKKTIAEIDKITSDPDLYYKNLVRLKIEGQTLGGDTYTEDLQYRAINNYVRTINALHEENNPAIRFKCLDGLTPEDLYFLMVYGQDEIYTSSFLGTFSRMMERLKPRSGDSLLATVNYDHFRTFLRMCAGYSTLQDFLATMKPEQKTTLMKSFISNLESGKPDDLEDAVDVADAYGSLEDSALTVFLREEVLQNYKRVSDARSTKGVIVYGLLSTIFKGGAPDEISNDLKLPPINMVPYKSLSGDTGVVFEQFFFYGDDDGKQSYEHLMGYFKEGGKWKITNPNKYWTTITSTSGKPVIAYASNPLQGEGEDEVAQRKLGAYLDSLNIHPAFVIHRGHSYHLSGTIEQLQKSARIVMLGSCGGYHNLGPVLDHSPDAQLISTKQTGTMAVNELVIKEINSYLLAGKDVDWIAAWRSLDVQFKALGQKVYKDFREYVPPQRNLGAIFIKAYRRLYNSQES